ncbi:UDP-N-acetylglucosamine 2-epimerase (non-hydrolyzing) [Panacibacter sp. DH6]|uniref:UDP-N-acetylglucosamine 2-epimerase (non-hydrolyzing) n=1 Tax=Panacibacter microcysteis TaxID=2793269 RepID=A0A931E970_9BACT|nr:UDP-N-acetylglucosamine 2-epimerase (non-hydrolyzing) [Panacibacter microcysteis]MBG9377464.1 UDP-N-acetylglucosamine 2-epimerase (non-hydrolyzing) [Panacibacter microcysteis]
MKKLLFVFGTRPEAIKMAPLILKCLAYPEMFEVRLCLTGQHKEMLQQVMDFFKLKPDYNLALMMPDQTLFDITANCLLRIQKVLDEYHPDLVLVQGDTSTAFAGALAAFYKKIKTAHVEAGLRSFDNYSPFPEEVNRRLTGIMAHYHFAPTPQAVKNLHAENIHQHIYLTGNTVIDALLLAVERVRIDEKIRQHFSFLDAHKKVILITAHRRESFGVAFEDICNAILTLANLYKEVQFVYPVHPNPNVQKIVHHKLDNVTNIFLIDPLSYPHLVWMMDKCYFVITDSGGIQEEAPSLGKPVIVIRDVTERTEGISAGTSLLAGTKTENIVTAASSLLTDDRAYEKMAKSVNPYGTGNTAQVIIDILLKEQL